MEIGKAGSHKDCGSLMMTNMKRHLTARSFRSVLRASGVCAKGDTSQADPQAAASNISQWTDAAENRDGRARPPGFPARLERLQAVRLGTRRAAAADQELSRLVRALAADDAGRCARHHGPDGPERRSRTTTANSSTSSSRSTRTSTSRISRSRFACWAACSAAISSPATSACWNWPTIWARACCRRSTRRPACRTSSST